MDKSSEKEVRYLGMVPSFHSGLMSLGKRNDGVLLETS